MMVRVTRPVPSSTGMHRHIPGSSHCIVQTGDFAEAGGGVIDAFNEGLQQIESLDWDFIVKLDADLSFAPDYFERCFAEFEKDESLGIGGGCIYHEQDGALKLEANPMFHVRGATKIYKRECWESLAGSCERQVGTR